MQLEGKAMGYSKKTLVMVAIGVIAAGIIFYAGAKYEKHKLSSLGLLKGGTESSAQSSTPKTKKGAKAGATDSTGTETGNTNATVNENSQKTDSKNKTVNPDKTTSGESSLNTNSSSATDSGAGAEPAL